MSEKKKVQVTIQLQPRALKLAAHLMTRGVRFECLPLMHDQYVFEVAESNQRDLYFEIDE